MTNVPTKLGVTNFINVYHSSVTFRVSLTWKYRWAKKPDGTLSLIVREQKLFYFFKYNNFVL